MQRKIFCVLICAVMFCATVPHAEGAETIRAQLDESERHLSNALQYFMEQDYWNAIDQLNRALRANTYLVDFYLMNALNLQRTGDLSDAQSSLASYLEVRPMDQTAPRILNTVIEQEQILRRALSSRPLAARWRFSQMDLPMEFQSGLMRPFNVKGMGKAEALGNTFCISDTVGEKVYIITIDENAKQNASSNFTLTNNENVKTINVKAPAVTLPLGDGSFYAFSTNGDIYVFNPAATAAAVTNAPFSPERTGHIDSFVTDAEWLSSSEFAVSDPVSRHIAFYNRQTLTQVDSWAPPESELQMLFEPVAMDRYADWMAIIDRGNHRLHILDLRNRRDFFSVNLPFARDVLWSSLGELFVLTERGEIFRLDVNFNDKSISVGEPLWTELENAWTLFHSANGGMYCLDVGGSKIWRADMLPSQTVNYGFLSLCRPTLAMEANRESFLLQATLSSPFAMYCRETSNIIHCIWNERSLNALTIWNDEPFLDAVLINRADANIPSENLSTELRLLQVTEGHDILSVLPPLWSLHRGTLTNVIIDSSIPFALDDLMNLTGFCIMNGLELDILAREIPSIPLTRASALTGGRTVYALGSSPMLAAPKTRLQIQIPLPDELSSSGYPSRSMLSVYMDIGIIQTRSWIPLWPDMLY